VETGPKGGQRAPHPPSAVNLALAFAVGFTTAQAADRTLGRPASGSTCALQSLILKPAFTVLADASSPTNPATRLDSSLPRQLHMVPVHEGAALQGGWPGPGPFPTVIEAPPLFPTFWPRLVWTPWSACFHYIGSGPLPFLPPRQSRQPPSGPVTCVRRKIFCLRSAHPAPDGRLSPLECRKRGHQVT